MTAWRLGGGAFGALAAAALAAYVAWPCVADPPDAGARARATFAGEVGRWCEAALARAATPTFSCFAETEAADLPLVPRACVGRAHRVLRLHVAPAPGVTGAAPPRVPALTDGRPLVVLESVLAAVTPGGGGWPARLAAQGFREVEVFRDDQSLGRVALATR